MSTSCYNDNEPASIARVPRLENWSESMVSDNDQGYWPKSKASNCQKL